MSSEKPARRSTYSQKFERLGWVCLPALCDDWGFSRGPWNARRSLRMLVALAAETGMSEGYSHLAPANTIAAVEKLEGVPKPVPSAPAKEVALV